MVNLFRRRIETVLQFDAAECGLAALAMIARFHGRRVDLPYLRSIRPVSRRGMTLQDLIDVASQLGCDARGFALDTLDDLAKVSLPAILHWSGNHYVVLEAIGAQGYVVHDPALGRRVYKAGDLARHFGGIVLEVEPRIDFATVNHERDGVLLDVLRSCRGLWASAVQIAVISLTVALLGIATPVLLQLALDVVLPQFDLDLLTILALGLALFLVFEAIGRWLRDLIVLKAAIQFQVHFTRNVVGHIFRLPMSFFEGRHAGDVVARLDSIEAIKGTVVRGLVVAVADSVTSILMIVLMLSYSPVMTLAVLATLVVLIILRFAFFPALKERSAASLVAHSEERSSLLDGLRRAEALKAHNAAEAHVGRWFEGFVRFANADYAAKRIERHADLVLHLLIALSSVAILYVGVASVMQSTMSVGMLYAFFALKNQFYERVDRLTREILNWSVLKVHLARVDDLAAEVPEIAPGSFAVERSLKTSVRLDGVAVQFARDEAPIVAGVDLILDIARSESVAIVGPSGSGKASLLRLVAGLHAPHAGQVLADGQPLARYGLQAYRRQLGVVLADDGLLAGTVAENLAMFRPDVGRETMEAALASVGLLDEIEALPQGFGTLVSSEQTLLSTGQRRRLLAARALCRSPRLLLLDEVTANLDPRSEDALLSGLLGHRAAKVFVTHSARVIERVDRVLAVEGGRLVARPKADALRTLVPA